MRNFKDTYIDIPPKYMTDFLKKKSLLVEIQEVVRKSLI